MRTTFHGRARGKPSLPPCVPHGVPPDVASHTPLWSLSSIGACLPLEPAFHWSLPSNRAFFGYPQAPGLLYHTSRGIENVRCQATRVLPTLLGRGSQTCILPTQRGRLGSLALWSLA